MSRYDLPKKIPDKYYGLLLQILMLENKKEREKRQKRRPKKRMREKERRDNVTILFPHLCFKVAPWSSW